MKLELLANMRLLGKASEGRGEDWKERSLELDRLLEGLGHELAEEAVYLWYNRAPGAVLEGEGQCLIARSVIGPLVDPPSGTKLVDWTATSTWTLESTETTWEGVLTEAFETWVELQRKGNFEGRSFLLRMRRMINPNFAFKIEVIFPA